ncbi:MAG TPA: hypothetical protein ENH62_13455 [Marinobacter sp.]|nr:hypothetical protein [Marinobacter sp.]
MLLLVMQAQGDSLINSGSVFGGEIEKQCSNGLINTVPIVINGIDERTGVLSVPVPGERARLRPVDVHLLIPYRPPVYIQLLATVLKARAFHSCYRNT